MEENQNPENQHENLGKPGNSKTSSKSDNSKTEKKSGIGTVLMVLSIIILLGVAGFLLFRDQEKTKVIQAKQNRIDTDSIKIAQQMDELNAMQAQLELWKSKADSLSMDIDSLETLIVDIEALKKDLRNARGRAANIQKEMNRIKSEVASREDQFKQLQAEREAALAKIDTLQGEKRMLSDTISKINQERVDLKQKVQLASILRAEDINFVAINPKGKEYPIVSAKAKGKEVALPVVKGKVLDKLKVNYFLGENKVAPQDSKKIVMRLIEPDGTVLFSGTEGGSFETAEGEEKMYTMAQEVSFSGSRQKGSFLYQKGNEYKSGKHTVEIYADGHKVGQSFFVVK